MKVSPAVLQNQHHPHELSLSPGHPLSCIIIIFRSVKGSITAYRSKAQPHGGKLHPTDSPIQQAFPTDDLRSRCLHLHIHIEQHRQHINAQRDSRIIENLIGSIPFKKRFKPRGVVNSELA